MRPLISFLLSVAVLATARGDVSLPSLFSDNMLLQRSKAAVFGKAKPGERVKVSLAGVSGAAVADAEGRWRAKLEGLKPLASGTMTVTAGNKLTIKNVAVGDVWLCAGQSNMALPVLSATHAQEEIALADSPEIRMFVVGRKSTDSTVDEVEGKWEVCDPGTVGRWPGIAYFFARQLRDDLEVPVGIVAAAWAGAAAQSWTPKAVLEGDPDLKGYCEQWERNVAAYPAAKEAYEKAMKEWQVIADTAKAGGKPAPRPPLPPFAPGSFRSPGSVFNGMIQPLTACAIRGVIWCQGEAHVRDTVRYRKLLPALIASWRKAWGMGELPFLYTQISNFLPRRDLPADSDWAELRDVQRTTLEVPNTAMAVTLDLGDTMRYHPRNKREVGRRLAVAAEARVYGKDLTGSGPLFEGATFAGDAATVRFKPGTARGLMTRDGEAVKGFALAGEDHRFVWADATISGSNPAEQAGTLKLKPKKGKAPPVPEQTLTVSSLAVPNPVAVRYAWADNPEANLVNRAGLPASSFRSDTWPQDPPKPLPFPTPKPATSGTETATASVSGTANASASVNASAPAAPPALNTTLPPGPAPAPGGTPAINALPVISTPAVPEPTPPRRRQTKGL